MKKKKRRNQKIIKINNSQNKDQTKRVKKKDRKRGRGKST